MIGKRGATLVETVVAASIFIAFMSMGMVGFISIYRTYRLSGVIRDTQQNARSSMEVMAKTIRQSRSVNLVQGDCAITLVTPSDEAILIARGNASPPIKDCSGNTVLYDGTAMTQTDRVRVTNLQFWESDGVVRIQLSIANPPGLTTFYDQDSTALDTSVKLEGLQ